MPPLKNMKIGREKEGERGDIIQNITYPLPPPPVYAPEPPTPKQNSIRNKVLTIKKYMIMPANLE